MILDRIHPVPFHMSSELIHLHGRMFMMAPMPMPTIVVVPIPDIKRASLQSEKDGQHDSRSFQELDKPLGCYPD